MATPRPVRVELERWDAVLLEPPAGRGGRRDRAGRRDVVGGDGVAQDGKHTKSGQLRCRSGPSADIVDERWLGDIRRGAIPGVTVTGGDRQCPPTVVAIEDGRIGPAEQFGVD